MPLLPGRALHVVRVVAHADEPVSPAPSVQQSVRAGAKEALSVVAARSVVVQVAVLLVRDRPRLGAAVRVEQGAQRARSSSAEGVGPRAGADHIAVGPSSSSVDSLPVPVPAWRRREVVDHVVVVVCGV